MEIGALRLNPEAVGNGSSTTVLVKRGGIVYNPIDITTTAIMIIIIIFFLFIDYNPLLVIDLIVLRCQIESRRPYTK
jgi:hypothetical protein